MDNHTSLEPTRPHSLARPDLQALQQAEILEVSPEEVPHLLDYWQVVLKRRWTVLVCLLVVFSTVAIGTLKKRPVYEGKVTLEIDPETPQVLNFKEVTQAVPTIDVDSYRETQYRILESRSLAEKVVKDLELYRVPEFYRWRMLFGLVEGDAAKTPSRSDQGPADVSSEAYRNAVGHLQTWIDVNPIRRSNLVELSFFSESPELAQRVANKIANDYIDQNLQVKWDETARASDWLQGRLGELKVKLEKSEEQLQAYAQANSIVMVTEKEEMANTRLAQLIQDYTKSQAERYQKESLYSLVQAGKVQDLPQVMGSRIIQDLSEQLADLKKRYAEQTTTYKPEYPKALQLKRQMDALQAEIDRHKLIAADNIADEYHSAVAQERFLKKAVDDQKNEVNNIAQRSVQYNIFKRDVDSYRQLYDGLLQRMKEARVSSGLDASNIRIVDSAELPKYPVKPRVLLNLMAGIVLGLGLGVALAFFQEYLDNTLKSPDEVERLLRLPSLGVLPKFVTNGNGKLDEDKLDALAPSDEVALAPAIQTDPQVLEAYRSLRTSILLSASPVPRLILVTSAVPGEGKTTTTVNLGATLASLGSRVVIVDCDMRRPACHRSTGVKNSPGFVQCLTGHVDLADAILPVPGVENLSVIPCGPIPPNPAEVLSAPLAGELLHKLRSQFEYVLVDSPPLLSVADSRILATLTDAAVLVARAFETPYDLVRRARSLLYAAGARVLGVALNDVDLRREGYGPHFSYRYGYGAYGPQPRRELGLRNGP